MRPRTWNLGNSHILDLEFFRGPDPSPEGRVSLQKSTIPWFIFFLLLAPNFGAPILDTVLGTERQARRNPVGERLPSVYTQCQCILGIIGALMTVEMGGFSMHPCLLNLGLSVRHHQANVRGWWYKRTKDHGVTAQVRSSGC